MNVAVVARGPRGRSLERRLAREETELGAEAEHGQKRSGVATFSGTELERTMIGRDFVQSTLDDEVDDLIDVFQSLGGDVLPVLEFDPKEDGKHISLQGLTEMLESRVMAKKRPRKTSTVSPSS